jgi:hypothetical protein
MVFENPDVVVTNQGASVVMFQPVTEEAKQWVDDNLELEGWQWLGPAFAVDHRMVEHLIDGMEADGLTVAH